MHQEANNNINSTINQINITDKESALILANTLQQCMNSNVQIVCNNENKLNKLYIELGKIVNSFDSLFYLSKNDIKHLNDYAKKMEIFEEDFQTESKDGIIFYNNLFALLQRLDINLFVNKYEESPEYIRNNLNNKYMYSYALFEINRKDEAIKIIDEIINLSNDDKYFIQKCYFLFVDKKIYDLKRLLSKKSNKNDKYGYYGIFELEVLFNKDKRINRLITLNKKYKGKPLYHLRMAKLIFEIDRKNTREIKDNIKQAFFNITDVDLLIVMQLIETAIEVKEEEYLLKLISDKKYNSIVIKSKILNLLIYKDNKSEKEIEIIKELMKDFEDNELVNINNVRAILALTYHKELEAIDYLGEAYKINKNTYTASNLLNLILKNNDIRNFDKIQNCIDTLNDSIKASDYMLISSAYLILGNKKLALENAYIGAILSQNNTEYFMRFWAVHTMFEMKNSVLKNVTIESVVELCDSRKVIEVSLDRNISSKFKVKNFQGIKFNDDNEFELNIIGKEIGDSVVYKGKSYKINKIFHKYEFFLKLIFPKINSGKYFKAIETGNAGDPLKGLKDFLIENKKNNDRHFSMYDLEKNKEIGLPLSSFVNNEEKTYRDIMLYLLYENSEYKLYAGEINLLTDNANFVIDITSLVMLEQFNLLERLEKFKERIYITQSTINTINKTFNYYLNNKKDSLSICIDENNELKKQELTESDYKVLQEFWRDILEISSKFNIINHESTLDKSKLESCQIDTIDYSINNNCTLISEDLVLKKLAYSLNNQVINSNNFLALAEKLCLNANEYINIVKSLAKGNYVYCLNEITFMKMIMYSMLNKECQETVIEIIDNVFSTEFLYYIYLNIIVRVIIYIFYYENIEDKTYYRELINKIQIYCKKYSNYSCYTLLEKIIVDINKENKF